MNQHADRSGIETPTIWHDVGTATTSASGRTAAPQPGGQIFSIRQQVDQRPWLMLGAAAVAGYALGSLGSRDTGVSIQPIPSFKTTDFASPAATAPQNEQRWQNQRSSSDMLAPLREELELLKSAAVMTIKSAIRDVTQEYMAARREQSGSWRPSQGAPDPTAGRDYIKTYHPPSEGQLK